MKKIALWLCGHVMALGLSCFPVQVQGMEWEAEIFGAHRKDRVTSLIKAYDPPGNLILTDSLVAKNIHVIEGGLRGKAALCNGLFVKGFGSLGKVNYGIYNENSYVPGQPTVRGRAKTNHGNAQDCSAGIGYQYEFNTCIRGGISGGWAYDGQDFKLSHAYFKVPDPKGHHDFDKEPAFILYGLKYKNRWQGPWVGLETRVYLPYITVDLGYEFHWAQWHAEWRLKGLDVFGSAFSDRRHSNQCYGNVGFINVNYNFFQCWTIAIGARYNYFKATNGHEKPLAGSFSAIGRNDTEVDKVRKATWQSFAMQMFLGYGF